MRLICPNCAAQYEVAEEAIPDTGRDVQCSNCGHTWFASRDGGEGLGAGHGAGHGAGLSADADEEESWDEVPLVADDPEEAFDLALEDGLDEAVPADSADATDMATPQADGTSESWASLTGAAGGVAGSAAAAAAGANGTSSPVASSADTSSGALLSDIPPSDRVRPDVATILREEALREVRARTEEAMRMADGGDMTRPAGAGAHPHLHTVPDPAPDAGPDTAPDPAPDPALDPEPSPLSGSTSTDSPHPPSPAATPITASDRMADQSLAAAVAATVAAVPSLGSRPASGMGPAPVLPSVASADAAIGGAGDRPVPDPSIAAPEDDAIGRQAEEARRRMARLQGEAAPPTEATLPPADAPRRDRLPDIETATDGLRAAPPLNAPSLGAARPAGTDYVAQAQADWVDPDARRGGFGRGLIWALILFALLAGLYLAATPLARAVPALGPALDGYVGAVDGARGTLDGAIRGLTDRIAPDAGA